MGSSVGSRDPKQRSKQGHGIAIDDPIRKEPLKNWLRFDRNRLVPLADVGGDDYQAAIVLDPDDEETYLGS